MKSGNYAAMGKNWMMKGNVEYFPKDAHWQREDVDLKFSDQDS